MSTNTDKKIPARQSDGRGNQLSKNNYTSF
nr:MAG TPA: hypothetical protein [Caudoviricetes sp.]